DAMTARPGRGDDAAAGHGPAIARFPERSSPDRPDPPRGGPPTPWGLPRLHPRAPHPARAGRSAQGGTRCGGAAQGATRGAMGGGGSVVEERANVRVVEGMFSSLQRGEIAGVLDRLSDDIEWRIAGPSELPYAGIHRGRDEVAKFFQAFGQAAEFEVFEPRE